MYHAQIGSKGNQKENLYFGGFPYFEKHPIWIGVPLNNQNEEGAKHARHIIWLVGPTTAVGSC